jgi:two-component system NtrC family sensor kinase
LSKFVESRETLLIPDLHEYPDGLETWTLLERVTGQDMAWAQSFASAPIYIDDEIAGVLILLSATPGFFTPDYKERLEALTSQVALSVKNARAHEAKHDLQVLSEALRDTTAALHSTLNAEKVMEIILENIGRAVPYDAANIMLVEAGIGHVACSQGYNEPEARESLRTLRFPIAETPNLQQMVTAGQPCIIPDMRTYPGKIDSQKIIRSRSYVGVPIRLAGKVVGFLNLESHTPCFYTSDHAEQLQIFAEQVAVAIRNSELFEDERRERLTSQTLQKTAETLASSVNLEDVLDRVINLLREIVDYNYATVMLLETTLLRPVATYDGSKPSQTHSTSFAYAEFPLLEEVLTSGELMVIPDTRLDARQIQPRSEATEIRTWVGAPLVASDTIIGLLTIGSDEPHAFSTYDLKAIRAFAQQAALAVRNAYIIIELDKNLTELREAQARLMRAARLSAAGETAAGVAHQINNPLGVIIGQAHMLLTDLPPDSQAYQAVEVIRRAAYRAGNIVQRMLNLTRKRAYDFQPVDINQSVQDAVMLIKSQIEPHIARLSVGLSPELPLIEGSKEHLEDVWLNLLLNARDAIVDSKIGEIKVTTRANAEGDAIEIIVKDNGKGIPPDDMNHLFQPFFTTKDHGIGLGLSICQDLIDQHGGTIQVKSKVGEGTTITVSLPSERF